VKSKKRTKAEAREEILRFFSKNECPILIGQACLALGPLWSLAETEGIFSDLVEQGAIHPLSPEERGACDSPHGFLLGAGQSPPEEAPKPTEEEKPRRVRKKSSKKTLVEKAVSKRPKPQDSVRLLKVKIKAAPKAVEAGLRAAAAATKGRKID